jgi:hypothetical protein
MRQHTACISCGPVKKTEVDKLYAEIRAMLDQARNHAWSAVNSLMVQAYWNIGRIIVEQEQKGRRHAGYGERLLEQLSSRLTRDYGRGFDPSNLRYMRLFYLTYQIRGALRHESDGQVICDALRRELSWTHYRLLLRVEKPEARAFYEAETERRIIEALHGLPAAQPKTKK